MLAPLLPSAHFLGGETPTGGFVVGGGRAHTSSGAYGGRSHTEILRWAEAPIAPAVSFPPPPTRYNRRQATTGAEPIV